MTVSDTKPYRVPDADVGERCSVLRSLDAFGDYWSLGVLRCAAFGYRRFGDFRAELGIASNILSRRLERLVAAGILDRVQYQERPPRFEYRLTAQGSELVPLILLLKEWGDRYLQPGGPRTIQRHRGCAAQVRLRLTCPDCGEELGPSQIETVNIPGGLSPSATSSSSGRFGEDAGADA
jgi:DNA-binding HxlR family transcriptional regulator